MNFRKYLNEEIINEVDEEVINEASTMTVSEFVSGLESAVKKIFPRSFVQIYSGKNLGSSITFRFALGKDKSEWQNGIIQNDPLFHLWMIGWESFVDDAFTKDKIPAELSVGGSLTITPEEGSYMAQGRAKIGWRKKTLPPDKLIKGFSDYFKKVKKVLKDNQDKLFDKDLELAKKKM